MPVNGAWSERISGIEALEHARLDGELVSLFERTAAAPRPIRFHVPAFKTWASSEISAPDVHAWPAVSITGAECRLQCDHCRARILAPMLAARTPEALWRVANEAVARGARGMLLSGGSNARNEVEYGAFLPTVGRIKRRFPRFRIAMHTALVDRAMARAIEQAGVDAAMLDVIGAQDTVAQVYHLRRPVADFERALEYLAATSLRVVPHIVIGLHYGRMLGEWNALEIVARHRPAALVLVVAMPFHADPRRPFETPPAGQVGRFFLDARRALAETPILLGCARPAGPARSEIDACAVLAGLDGIAHPAEGVVELALALGREATVSAGCCSIALEADEAAPRIDARLLAAAQQSGARGNPSGRLARIPVVAA